MSNSIIDIIEMSSTLMVRIDNKKSLTQKTVYEIVNILFVKNKKDGKWNCFLYSKNERGWCKRRTD